MDKLANLSTHPDLITMIERGALAVGGLVLLDVDGHPEETRLLNEQNKIGWFFFFTGFWTRSWAEVQERYLCNLP